MYMESNEPVDKGNHNGLLIGGGIALGTSIMLGVGAGTLIDYANK